MNPLYIVIINERNEEINKAINKIPKEFKEIIELYFGFSGQSCSLRKIGTIINKSAPAVNRRLKKGIKLIKGLLDIEGV